MNKKINIPKIFWKYYDLYRRNRITLNEYSLFTKISKETLLIYLQEVSA